MLYVVQGLTNSSMKAVETEYNDFEAIPDPDYTRSFLQRYAEVLDLDASVILHAYDSKSLVVYYEAGEEPDASIDLRRNVKPKKARKSYLPLIYLLLAAIFILIFVAYIVSSGFKIRPSPRPLHLTQWCLPPRIARPWRKQRRQPLAQPPVPAVSRQLQS